MPTLPTTTYAFASSATEAQFKTFLTGQREFLAGLLGTDGTAVTARATLGVNDGVTSVNGNTGAITAEQIAAAATAGYGYTPGKNGATFTFELLGTFNPDGVNIYATYGPGVYAANGYVFPITPSDTTIGWNVSVTIYKLSKD